MSHFASLVLVLFQSALLTVVQRDSFASSEREIFQALCRWCKQNSEDPDAREVMSAVRLPLMSLSEMLNVVRPSGLLSADELLDAIQTRSERRDMELNYRGMLGASLFTLYSVQNLSLWSWSSHTIALK